MSHVHAHRFGRLREQRGTVTFELAIGILSAVVLTSMLVWVISLVVINTWCAGSATQIARQLARGDTQAAHQAEEAAPRGATVNIDRRSDRVVVVVSTREKFGPLGPVSLRGGATAFWEPGVSQ